MRTRTSIRSWRLFAGVVIPLFISAVLLTTCGRGPAVHIENPYAGVDWSSDGQYKSNLHTHTTVGGARDEPQTVIDRYRELGYGILALTDHDDDSLAEPTWPWQEYDREPETVEMVAIQGNEISEVHHIGSHFSDYGDPEVESEEEALEEIGRRGGTALFHHPGRYSKGVDWYVEMYRRYDHLLGQEVYNRNERYP
jgi:predicted metal-dependent phosphoesterase TrpH